MPLLAMTGPCLFSILAPNYLAFIHDHVFRYLKFKLNPCQHGFNKSESTIANLVTYLDVIILGLS
jgi:hypothetical protein